MICPNGHRFDTPLILRSGDTERIVCPVCKECGCVFEPGETKKVEIPK